MKKVKLFYNPFSGNKTFKFDLDVCIGVFQSAGYEVHPFRTMQPGDIETHVAQMDKDYDIVVASGGDGTVNIVLNALMHNNLKMPLGIIPSGTANDFATFLGLKTGDSEGACRVMTETSPRNVDIDICFFLPPFPGGRRRPYPASTPWKCPGRCHSIRPAAHRLGRPGHFPVGSPVQCSG